MAILAALVVVPIGILFILSGFLVNLTQAILFVLVRPVAKNWYRTTNKLLLESLWLEVVWLFDWWAGIKVELHTDSETYNQFMGYLPSIRDCKENALLICNHRSDIDWLVGWILAQVPIYSIISTAFSYPTNWLPWSTVAVMKKELKYLPVIVEFWAAGGGSGALMVGSFCGRNSLYRAKASLSSRVCGIQRKRKTVDERRVITRATEARNGKSEKGKKSNMFPKRQAYYKKVVYDGVEFEVGDDVYVKRREDTDSDNEYPEVEECRLCFSSGDDVMIECDDCLGAFHLKCLTPPLKEVPEGDWICGFCEAQKIGRDVSFPMPPEGKKLVRTLREKLLSSNLWAAHIESIWKEGDGTYHCRVRWYVIPEETAIGRQPHNLKRELYRTNDFADIEMEYIIIHCFVMTPKEFAKANEGDDIFFCEYEYDVHWHAFKRLAEIDNENQVKVELKRHPMEELPETADGTALWCRDQFVSKDAALERYGTTGIFSEQEMDDTGRPKISLVVVIWHPLGG
ncbi:hypothetical protein K1719_006338 [Acacia pycnantha]|nr:hypothetical protein K1719_006338 [Acacia pycnantha]